ncbi:MAG: hypothetical protein ACOYNN_04185 [Terrimicrobiaceae bacterium]
MQATILGRPFGSGVNQAKDKYTEASSGSVTIESTYRTLWANWITTAPTRGSAHPVYPQAKLVNKTAEQITPGWLCDVTLTYEQPAPEENPATDNQQLPPEEYSESANEIEMPIEAHPNFATFATEANGAMFTNYGTADVDFKGWTKDSPFSGYMTFKVGSVTESKTTYYWQKPSSVSTLVGTCSGHWLTVSGSIARRFPYWTRTINRIYSTVPWNTTIYPG